MKKKQLRSRKNKRKVKVFKGGALPSNIKDDYLFTIEYMHKIVRFDEAKRAYFETDTSPAEESGTVFSIRNLNDAENTFVLMEISKEEAKGSKKAMFSKAQNPIRLSVKYVPPSTSLDVLDGEVSYSFFYIETTNKVINLRQYSGVEATESVKSKKIGFDEVEKDLLSLSSSAQPQRGRQRGVLNYAKFNFAKSEELGQLIKARGVELQSCIAEIKQLTSECEEIAARLQRKNEELAEIEVFRNKIQEDKRIVEEVKKLPAPPCANKHCNLVGTRHQKKPERIDRADGKIGGKRRTRKRSRK